MFQNIDPKSVTFVEVLWHISARWRKIKGRNRVLYKMRALGYVLSDILAVKFWKM